VISSEATFYDALKAMADQNLETILVVDQNNILQGVVDREQVLSKWILAMAK
jgi:predicted transcriptional regulator